ncbi:hypothetical protein, partial [Bradyrhizobium sp.]|uniref:hypothetical protein n=1 Tax=Bradyrhizobium sp. TaxID=376 RepID=UPI003C50A1E8
FHDCFLGAILRDQLITYGPPLTFLIFDHAARSTRMPIAIASRTDTAGLKKKELDPADPGCRHGAWERSVVNL